MLRRPPDILITTPESLFLLLTSRARAFLASVDTVIVDEIHALVGTKRGAHLALSLERLEEVARRPLQRIGLSATQRPLEEVARYLGGGEGLRTWKPRPVTIVDAGAKKAFDLRVEVPVEDMARLGEAIEPSADEIPEGPASVPRRRSIWPAIHPRLLELVRAHRSTIVFVNTRRLAERLAAALNELAGEEIARAHHGSIAREQRLLIEDALKAGRLPALVATSSLELGIDMGAVDLVVQIETPTSVASGMQRIGRASHQVEGVSRGIIFPKYRGDLLASAAITKAMKEGAVEETRVPQNPLDVLAQQLAAMVALGERKVDELYALTRRAAPYSALGRAQFEGVLDMLSGRYPSDEFAELRPRVVWDRLRGVVQPREGTQRLVVQNAGTIPDRGLYGVFLADGLGGTKRVGELDEEMVFESRAGEVFVLGATSWRITEITRDRVLVVPAPGEPGKMPFWKADRGGAAGRDGPRDRPPDPRAPGDHAGTRPPSGCSATTTSTPWPRRTCSPTSRTSARRPASLPDDRTIVLERTRDEMGDWRLCLLSPWGGRVHAPWATALEARLRQAGEAEVETIWSDDGIVLRLPERERPPEAADLLPEPEEIEDLVVRELGGTSLFAARFREAAARALLLPRRRPGQRTPLWMQRKRAHDLLQVAARYPSFPIVLEAYRECLRDVFDLPGLVEIASPRPPPRDPARHRGHAIALALLGVSPLRLRRQLPLRRRRAARRAARAGPRRRPGPAARAPRRGGAAGAHRPPGPRRAGGHAAGPGRRPPGHEPRAPPRPAAPPRRPLAGRGGGPRPAAPRRRRGGGGGRVARRARARAPRHPHPRRGRGALGRRRGRGAPARRARHRAAAGPSRRLPRAAAPRAARGRLALRAHARSLHADRRRPALRDRRGARPRRPRRAR